MLELADVADLNEVLIIRAENERRAHKAATKRAESQSRSKGRR